MSNKDPKGSAFELHTVFIMAEPGLQAWLSVCDCCVL